MKHWAVYYTIGLLLCATLLSVMPLQGEEQIYSDVIRLHILANSDSESDQALKLKVRDAILYEYKDRLACADEAEAEATVEALLPEIQQTAERVIREEGYGYTVTLHFTEEYYPTRAYGSLRFPAGEYRSLRIRIGEGTGQNWWCVLFPPLCVGAASGEDTPLPDTAPEGLTESEWRLVSADGSYEIRFRLLEMLSEWTSEKG